MSQPTHQNVRTDAAVEVLLTAYTRGIFPMADSRAGEIAWYRPEWRGVLPLDRFRVPRRLRKTVRQGRYEVRIDTAFARVVEACAAPTPDRPTTWISHELHGWYRALHEAGHAHSIEIWQDGELSGGLYGVALGGLFAGESMFSRRRDTSKLAVVHLVAQLRATGFLVLDTQFFTSHLAQFGVVEIHRSLYERMLAQALVLRPRWRTVVVDVGDAVARG